MTNNLVDNDFNTKPSEPNNNFDSTNSTPVEASRPVVTPSSSMPASDLNKLRNSKENSNSNSDGNDKFQSGNKPNGKHIVDLYPKLKGFLLSYIIFSLPGFVTGLIWTLISFLILIGVIGAMVGGSGKAEEAALSFKEVSDSGGKTGVLIYDLSGAITSQTSNDELLSPADGIISVSKVKDDFSKIRKNKDVKNVVFRLNTGGGEVFASKILGEEIRSLSKDLGQEESVFYFDEVVASGGLWAAYTNTKNYVVANQYGETGSIGVLASLPNFAGTAEKVGYKETIVKSSPQKDIGNPLREPTDADVAYIKNRVDAEYEAFKEIVKIGRKMDSGEVDKIATGLTFPNTEAKTLRLVDELGGVNQAIERAAKNADLTEYKVWEVEHEANVLNSLLSGKKSSLFGLGDLEKISQRVEKFRPGVLYAVDEIKY